MSKLARAIVATLTNNVRAIRDQYIDVKMHMQDHAQLLSREVRLSVTLQCTKWLEASMLSNTDIKQTVQQDIKRAMIEEVFGEFRPMLIEMRSALYDADTTRLRTLLAELEHVMFTEGL